MQLASIFQDGAVFQRNAVIPVWGKTSPRTNVRGVLNGIETFSCSADDGSFTIYFPGQSAGGPFSMEISSKSGRVVLNDICIGEVWLVSGQSNMQYQLNSDWRTDTTGEEIPLSREQEKEFFESRDKNKFFRYFHVPQNASGSEDYSTGGCWKDVDPDAPAVASWFGLYLQKNLDVPIGIIAASWGGTIAEAWMSFRALASCPNTKELFANVMRSHCNQKNYDVETCIEPLSVKLATLFRPDTENAGFAKGFHEADFDDSKWKHMTVPGSWIRQHIAGNGAVWIRNKITIPYEWVGKELTFCSGGIDKQDISYCNGVEIGRTGEGASMNTYNVPRRYIIPAELVTSTEVSLAIRGYSAVYDGRFDGNWALQNNETSEKISISGKWRAKVELDLGYVTPKRDAALFAIKNQHTPGILFNSMIRPLIPYAVAGTIWYQGESNAVNPQASIDYYENMQYLIRDWRYNFINPEMPFLIVQLPGYGENTHFDRNSAWAYLRESQRKLAETMPGVIMASAIDCGEKQDIHPQDKQTVGFRLASSALNKVYKQLDIVPNGPELLRVEQIAPGTVKLDFAQAKNMYINDEVEQCFFLSEDGEDFFAADTSTVDGASVLLCSNTLKNIRFIRYAWADFPLCSLYNGDGFPASPFSVELP